MSDEICRVKMRDGNPCGRLICSIDEMKCIFHLKNKSDVADIFNTEFRRELERMEKDNDIEELDFKGFIFHNLISFYQHIFEKPVYFSGAQFNEAHFSSSKFNDIVDFSGAHFKELADFFNTQFNNKTDFSNAQFNKVIFSDAQFQESNFYDVKFQEASFFGVQFNNKADFSDAKFNNEVYFSRAKFQEASFFGVQFNNKADFSETQFNNGATFEDSEFHSVASFINVKFSSIGEDLISFKNVKFLKPKDVRFQKISLRIVSFLNTDITEIEFLDVKWARKNGRLAVIDETRIGKDGVTTYDAVAQLYRRLRRNYETNYRFAEAGEFFFGEMELRRHNVSTRFKNKMVKKNVLWFKRNFFILGLYKHLSLYGESYVRPVIWAIIVIISYPMLMNLFFNASLPQYDDFPYTYIRTSASSFFQLGNMYMGERLIGFLLLGLLFVALKRQFERKK